MKFLIVAALLAASPAGEAKNQKTVDDATKLCAESKCQICGKFSYRKYGEHTNEVEYSPSYCEEEYKRAKEKLDADAEDLAIRKKYGKTP